MTKLLPLLLATALWIGPVVSAQGDLPLDPIAAPASDPRLGHSPPEIRPTDAAYLMTQVRRMLMSLTAKEVPSTSTFVPLGLKEIQCRVAVSVRDQGRLLGLGESGYRPLMEACREAATKAWGTIEDKRKVTLETGDALGLEIELIGPRDRVGDGLDSHVGMALQYLPAWHGIAVRAEGKEWLVRASQLISRANICIEGRVVDHECNRYAETLLAFRKKMGLTGDKPAYEPEEVVFLRFASTHLYQPSAEAEAIQLHGGMRLVEQEEVTRERLLAAADEVARYMVYRQNSDGAFSYEYLPGRDMYWPEENWVRQASSTWALAVYARERKDRAASAAIHRSLEAFRKMIQPVKNQPAASYVHTPDDKHALGTTALVALAMMDAPGSERYEDSVIGLVQGMVSMQNANGSFKTNFPPSLDDASQNFYPGEALLALVRRYEQTGNGDLRAVCDRALPYYQKYFRARANPMFVPWQTQAWARLARKTHLERYAEFAFGMSDILLETQVDAAMAGEGVGQLAMYDGAFNPENAGVMGIATGVYLEGLVEAQRTAELFEDAERSRRYGRAIEKGIRFVVQLQFRKEEGYYIGHPRDVIGGVRASPIDPTLRIDHCQHALASLLGAYVVLGPSGEE